MADMLDKLVAENQAEILTNFKRTLREDLAGDYEHQMDALQNALSLLTSRNKPTPGGEKWRLAWHEAVVVGILGGESDYEYEECDPGVEAEALLTARFWEVVRGQKQP